MLLDFIENTTNMTELEKLYVIAGYITEMEYNDATEEVIEFIYDLADETESYEVPSNVHNALSTIVSELENIDAEYVVEDENIEAMLEANGVVIDYLEEMGAL